jgi:phosphoribosyl 1,2-cyclic phosphodiesterase/GAF domain-containing protein
VQVTFWGTRGSIAKAGPRTVRYGGNTSCVELRTSAGHLVVIDAGTGLHELGQRLIASAHGRPIHGNLLISHTHWDHIQGLPFFAPLFVPGNQWHIYGPRGVDTTLSQILAGQMEYTYFPVALEDLGATIDYHDLVEGTFELDDLRITTQYLHHPALTLGYRIEGDGVVVVYSSDHEPHAADLAAGGVVETSRGDARHLALLRDADLVIHDSQYLAEEYDTKQGWGHSTMEYVVDAAIAASVRRLALYHHDPTRTDDAVDEMVVRARARAAHTGLDVFAAAEEMTVEITPVEKAAPAAATRLNVALATVAPAVEALNPNVLVAVRDATLLATLRDAADAEGLRVITPTTADADAEIRGLLHAHQPGIVVLDDGYDVRAALDAAPTAVAADGAPPAVVVVTEQAPDRVDAIGARVTDWLVWPASPVHVRTKLRAWVLRHACQWQSAPLPADEARRVDALHGLHLLDTDPEERFDRVTAAASALFDVPLALVTLVDADRQWFKSHHGTEVTETARDLSVCAHTILGDDVLVVPDALTDPRFADNPLVQHPPRLRFYAGVPLTLADGTRVGALCILDHRPRMLDRSELDELRQLGKLVETELESGAP